MATHGGSRPGAGRPAADREPLRRVTVTLPDFSSEQRRRYGDNNLSEGIRLLVEEAYTATGRPWYVLPEWAKDPKAAPQPLRAKRPPVT